MVIKRSEIRKISVTIPCGTYCETGAEQSLPLKYEVASLVFNTEADPVATIRGINGQAYIQLERQNMYLWYWFTVFVLRVMLSQVSFNGSMCSIHNLLGIAALKFTSLPAH